MSDKCSLSFSSLIKSYSLLRSSLAVQVNALASNISTATPGSFILLQFEMSQITQIGDSISNLIAQVNTVINKAVSNQRTQ